MQGRLHGVIVAGSPPRSSLTPCPTQQPAARDLVSLLRARAALGSGACSVLHSSGTVAREGDQQPITAFSLVNYCITAFSLAFACDFRLLFCCFLLLGGLGWEGWCVRGWGRDTGPRPLRGRPESGTGGPGAAPLAPG